MAFSTAAVSGAPDHLRFDHERLAQFAGGVLHRWGMRAADACTAAELVVESDLRGVDSHGVSMLPQYERLWQQGRIDVAVEPLIERDHGATAVVDARHGLGHLAMKAAVEHAVSQASGHGIAMVTVRRSQHFGCAGVYATIAPARGMLALLCSTTRTRAVVPTRSLVATLGTNPLAFAAPSGDPERPVLLDMATSATAVNRVKMFEQKHLPVPGGLVVDAGGAPITEPALAYAQARSQSAGGLLPLGGPEATGGHKGYGLALMVQILAGALTGSTFAPLRSPDLAHDDIGHCCIVIDPAAFGDNFIASVQALTTTLRRLEPADASAPVLVPGDPEWSAKRDRLQHGVPLPPTLVEALTGVGERAGVRMPAPLAAGDHR